MHHCSWDMRELKMLQWQWKCVSCGVQFTKNIPNYALGCPLIVECFHPVLGVKVSLCTIFFGTPCTYLSPLENTPRRQRRDYQKNDDQWSSDHGKSYQLWWSWSNNFRVQVRKSTFNFLGKKSKNNGCKMPEKKQCCPIYVLNLGFVVSKEKEGCLSQDFVTELKLWKSGA